MYRTTLHIAEALPQRPVSGYHMAQMLMTDRVSERRRAAQLARHYRDQKGLTIAEIARRLGRGESTVKAYL